MIQVKKRISGGNGLCMTFVADKLLAVLPLRDTVFSGACNQHGHTDQNNECAHDDKKPCNQLTLCQ
jgi:hypothetical protein